MSSFASIAYKTYASLGLIGSVGFGAAGVVAAAQEADALAITGQFALAALCLGYAGKFYSRARLIEQRSSVPPSNDRGVARAGNLKSLSATPH